jgi:hypothetical protein
VVNIPPQLQPLQQRFSVGINMKCQMRVRQTRVNG